MDDPSVIDAQVLNQAVAWMVRTQEIGFSFKINEDLRAWLDADPAHLLAWKRLNASLNPFRVVDAVPGLGSQLVGAIERKRSRREFIRAIPVLIGTAGALAATDRFYPLDGIISDVSTRTGERRSITLPEGSVLQLNARSRADLSFDSGRRRVRMLEGTGIVSVQPGYPPLVLSGQDVALQMERGSAMLTLRANTTSAICLSGSARLTVGQNDAKTLSRDEGYGLHGSSLWRLTSEEIQGAAAWTDGRLILQNRRLTDMIEAYRPYTAGLISMSSAAANQRVSGLFDLDRMDEALEMVRKVLPIRVMRLGTLITRIDVDPSVSVK